MGRKDDLPGDAGRDYATLLGMGWTPDTIGEAVSIAAELLREGESDAAMAAVENARAGLLTAATSDADRAELEVIAFEVALRREDSSRAIGAANALKDIPTSVPHGEVSRLRAELSRSNAFRPELREALEGVLDVVLASGVEDASRPRAGAETTLSIDGPDDELPYLEAEPGVLGIEREEGAGRPSWTAGDRPDWMLPPERGIAGASWIPGEFVVDADEDLRALRARFLDAAAASASEHAFEACETAWSFFLMEDFDAAALLFDQALGDPSVRVSAAEGLVRCRLNLSQAGEAVALLERLESLCFAEGLPDALRYWLGRSAEAAGDARKARSAYRSLPADVFPDVRGRLGGLP